MGPQDGHKMAQDVSTSVQKAIHVDDETAVLVRSKKDGQQRLITPQAHRGPFYPAEYDEIVEVRSLIRIEPHEVVIAADEKNHIIYYDGRTGDGSGLAVFLPPLSANHDDVGVGYVCRRSKK